MQWECSESWRGLNLMCFGGTLAFLLFSPPSVATALHCDGPLHVGMGFFPSVRYGWTCPPASKDLVCIKGISLSSLILHFLLRPLYEVVSGQNQRVGVAQYVTRSPRNLSPSCKPVHGRSKFISNSPSVSVPHSLMAWGSGVASMKVAIGYSPGNGSSLSKILLI